MLPEDLLKKANKQKREGKLNEAIANYRSAIELNPNSFLLHQNLGDALVKKGLLDEGTLELRKALEIKPNSALSQAYLGEVLVKQKLFDEAIDYLESAIKIQPNFHKYYNSLGLALIGKEKYDEAIVLFQKAIELKPDSCWGYYNLSQVLSKQDKLSSAKEYYEKAIQLNPQLSNHSKKPINVISPPKDSPKMVNTGERYVPHLKGTIKYEHLHRYGLCLEIVRGKSVLDIASGEGYGSVILSQTASSVIGVDIDTESVKFAQNKYQDKSNLQFLVGRCDSIPLSNESIDVVVSFETIEHHDKHEEMMQEIKRVLKKDGVLVISSPNRLVYSDLPNYHNPFHVKELYEQEFVDLLNRYFSHTKIYGQRLATSSFVFPLDKFDLDSFNSYTGNGESISKGFLPLHNPVYFIAISSNQSIDIQNKLLNSFYLDRDDDLLNSEAFPIRKKMSLQKVNELSLAIDGNAETYMTDGWSDPEEWGCWALGPYAGLKLELTEAAKTDLKLVITAKARVSERKNQSLVIINLNGQTVGELLFPGGENFVTEELTLPLNLLADRVVLDFVLNLPDYYRPTTNELDQRPLGLAVSKISINY
ncbi:tetratricopeptide repeat protein [Dapis sp. BLCC M126]